MWLPDNLISHREAWISALQEHVTDTTNPDDKLYWEHELNAMKKMYEELDMALLAEDEAKCHPGFPTGGF